MTRDGGFQVQEVESLTTDIVEKISLMEGVDPLELQPPLQTVIDLDAVEDIMSPTGSVSRPDTVSITFEYGNLEITVERDDDISVRAKKQQKR